MSKQLVYKLTHDEITELLSDALTLADFYGDKKNYEPKPMIHISGPESGACEMRPFIELDHHGALARKFLEKWRSWNELRP